MEQRAWGIGPVPADAEGKPGTFPKWQISWFQAWVEQRGRSDERDAARGWSLGVIHHNLQKFHCSDSVLNRPSSLGANGVTLLVDRGGGKGGGEHRPGRSQDLSRLGQQ